jgi:hypothetical protein
MVESPEESVARATRPHARGKRNCLIFLLVWAVVSGSVYAVVDVEWEKPLLILDLIVFALAIIKCRQKGELVPQVTNVTGWRPKFAQIDGSLPSFPSRCEGVVGLVL